MFHMAGAAAGNDGALAKAAEQLAVTLLGDATSAGAVYERFLQAVEPPLLAAAMTQSNHQCAPAARALGLHRTTLKRKLDEYGIVDKS
jgi:DNA-binding protein Fis